MSTDIEPVYTQLRDLLYLDTWQEVPKTLVCLILHSKYPMADIHYAIGWHRDAKLNGEYNYTCQQIMKMI